MTGTFFAALAAGGLLIGGIATAIACLDPRGED